MELLSKEKYNLEFELALSGFIEMDVSAGFGIEKKQKFLDSCRNKSPDSKAMFTISVKLRKKLHESLPFKTDFILSIKSLYFMY